MLIHERLIELPDGWALYKHHYRLHSTSTNKDWWAVRHLCAIAKRRKGWKSQNAPWFGTFYRPGTTCAGCDAPIPEELEGFINLLEWSSNAN